MTRFLVILQTWAQDVRARRTDERGVTAVLQPAQARRGMIGNMDRIEPRLVHRLDHPGDRFDRKELVDIVGQRA